MSELAWRFFVWMSEPSKLKGLAWRFFFWITPRWLSKKWQLYMLHRIVERHPAEVERKIREALKQQFGACRSEEELAALSKDALDLMLHPQADAQGGTNVRRAALFASGLAQKEMFLGRAAGRPSGGYLQPDGVRAKVKIAPIERWCHGALKKLEEKPAYGLLPGQECEIFTDTVTCWPYCEGRVWQLTPESINKLSQVTGMPPVGPVGGLCEHVLELD